MGETKQNTYKILALFFVLFVYFFGSYWAQRNAEMFEIDEASWIYSTYYYHLFFEERDYQSAEWKAQDALDHPPLAKYLYGWVLSWENLQTTSPEPKREWYDSAFKQQYVVETRAKIPPEAFKMGRAFHVFCHFIIAISVFLILKYRFSFLAGLFGSLLYATSPLIMVFSALVLSDGILLMFIMMTVLFQIRWSEQLEHGKTGYLAAFLVGLLSAFSSLTKISGVLCLVISELIFLSYLFNPARRKKIVIGNAILVTVFVFTVLALNPSFYSDPLSFAREMLHYRNERLQFQMEMLPLATLANPWISISKAAHYIFFSDLIHAYTRIPWILILTLIGCYQLTLSFREHFRTTAIILVNAMIWISFTVTYFKIEWPRYLVPVVPFVMLFAALGLEAVYKKLSCFLKSNLVL